MAFNEFDRPLEAQPIQTYVSQHVALPFKEYRAAIQDKQNQFDEEASRIEQDEASFAKVRAMQHDVAYRGEKEAEYQDRINKAIEKNKGDLAAGSQDFRRISKDLQYDLTRGALGAMDKKVAAYGEFTTKIDARVQKGDITKEQGELATMHALNFTQPVQRGVLKEGESYSLFKDFDPANYLDQSKKFEDLASKLKEDAEKGTTEIYDPETQMFVKTAWGTKELNPTKIYNTLMGSHFGDSKSVGYTEDMGKLHNDLNLYDIDRKQVNRAQKEASNKEALNNKIASGKEIEPWEYETDPEHRKVALLAWGTAKGFAHTETESGKSLADASAYTLRVLANAKTNPPAGVNILKTFTDKPTPLGTTEEEVQTKKLQSQQQRTSIVNSALDNLIKTGATTEVKGAAAALKANYEKNPDAVIQGLLAGTLELPGMTKAEANKTISKLKAADQTFKDVKQREVEVVEAARQESGFNNTLYVDHAAASDLPGVKGNMQKLLNAYLEKDMPFFKATTSAETISSFVKETLGNNTRKFNDGEAGIFIDFLRDGQKRFDKFQEAKENIYTRTAHTQETSTLSTVPNALTFNQQTKTYAQDDKVAVAANKAVASFLGNLTNLNTLNGAATSGTETVENVDLGEQLIKVFGADLTKVKPGTLTWSTVGGKSFVSIPYQDTKTGKHTTVTVSSADLNVPELQALNNSGANKADAYIEERRGLGLQKSYPIPSNKNFVLHTPQDRVVDEDGNELKAGTEPYFEQGGVRMTLDEGKMIYGDYLESKADKAGEVKMETFNDLLAKKASLKKDEVYYYMYNGEKHKSTGQQIIDYKP